MKQLKLHTRLEVAYYNNNEKNLKTATNSISVVNK
jgi:hypothetical protein